MRHVCDFNDIVQAHAFLARLKERSIYAEVKENQILPFSGGFTLFPLPGAGFGVYVFREEDLAPAIEALRESETEGADAIDEVELEAQALASVEEGEEGSESESDSWSGRPRAAVPEFHATIADPPPRGWFEVIVVTTLAALGPYASCVGMLIWPESTAPVESFSYQEFWRLIYDVPVILVVLYVIGSSSTTPREHFGLGRIRFLHDTGLAVLLLMASACLYVPTYLAEGIFTEAAVEESAQPAWPKPQHFGDYALAFVAIAISALTEELVFRSYLITRLQELTRRTWLSVLASAIIFGGYHSYQGVFGWVSITIHGIFFGLVFSWTRRIWPLVISHILWNLVVL